MRHSRPPISSLTLPVIGALLLFGSLLLPSDAKGQLFDDGYTASFPFDHCHFSTIGANRYFVLRPGHQIILEGTEENDEGGVDEIRLVITVTRKTKKVAGVRTRVVEEREYLNGELFEVSKNYFAICLRTSSVYYFGEAVDFYEDGEVINHDGSWLAGQDGAMPGVIMPGDFLLGSRYYQEVAPGIALDRAEHTASGLTVATPFGTLDDCVETLETTPLEPDAMGTKLYAPGIGLVNDGPLWLVDVVSRGNRHGDDD